MWDLLDEGAREGGEIGCTRKRVSSVREVELVI